MLRLAGATVNQIPAHWAHNTANILHAIDEARHQQAQVVCFPELCITGYGCEDLFLSDWLPARAWEELEKIIPACQGITVCVGLPVRIEGITYNGVAVIQNSALMGITLKQNLARDGVHYEPRWFEPWEPGRVITLTRGNSAIPVGDVIYSIEGITTGFEICEDAWRRERPADNLCRRGVQLILNPSASHFALGKSITREKLVTDSSVAYNCVYVYVNLLGNEAGRMIYDGDILVAQNGRLLAQNNRLSFTSFQVISLQVDLQQEPASDHLPLADSKDTNEEFARAESLALYDYLRKSRAKGFTLSLSGGADSATCAVLVAEMIRRASGELGWKPFLRSLSMDENLPEAAVRASLLACAYQATRQSSEQTLHAARTLADSMGASFYHWSIQDEVDTYTSKLEQAIGRKTTWETDDIALQNIQARARSPIIWMLANIRQSVLLTTSNRSEGDVGYATMDGDTSGSLAPIAGVSKPFILQWLKWAEKNLGYSGLAPVNNLQPTAELRPQERHQTDEADLMPYPLLEQIERLAFQERRSPVEVYAILCKNSESPDVLKGYVRKFFRMWAANQWKRERLAPSFHIDDMNVDPRTWLRFPILSSGFADELARLDSMP